MLPSTPLDLPEILMDVGKFLDVADLALAVQVSTFWNSVLRPILRSRTVCWKDTMSEEEHHTALQRICQGNLYSLECELAHFTGETYEYETERQNQVKVYEPIKAALLNPTLELHKWVVRGGNFVVEDFFVVLLELKTLRHFWIDPLPGRKYAPDLSRLFKVLGRPLLQNLRQLTVKNAHWGNMGFPFPNKVQCQLRKIVLENTRLFEPNLFRLLESSPWLEELVALQVMEHWEPSIFKHLSKVNPRLRALTFSCHVSRGCNDDHVEWMAEHLTVDLRQLGLYQLQCSTNAFVQLVAHFKGLTHLEIHGASHENCGELVHHYLSTCSGARQLIARDVFIPMRLLEDQESEFWICKDLDTLDVSFGERDPMQDEQEDQVVEESKLLFGYLTRHVPNVRKLRVRKHKLCVKPGEGIVEQFRGLERLERLMIQSGSFAEDACLSAFLAALQRQIRVTLAKS
ncbi:hypothetical protein BGX34_005688 [Mortierella sp. NVP85]|nr:hypothetical protein BGX34_005688 [Mortierella sp. NVP85]